MTISKNATFLFYRDFMEYHQDRFDDYSLLVYKKDELVALFPANRVGDRLYSHQGLTYGGLILSTAIKLEETIAAFSILLKFLFSQGVNILLLKQMPSIYNRVPSEETQYLSFILRAELYRRDVLSVIDLKERIKISNNRVEGYKRGKKHGLAIREVDRFDTFWNEILIENLKSKHQAKPVHNLEEITLLKHQFPENIRQFNVYNKDKIVAGATIFETKNVAHCQYISGNKEKNQLGCLDLLHIYLIDTVFKHKKFFDFGVSNENSGRNINQGLLFWKEGFGARTITQDFYKIETNNYHLLDEILI